MDGSVEPREGSLSHARLQNEADVAFSVIAVVGESTIDHVDEFFDYLRDREICIRGTASDLLSTKTMACTETAAISGTMRITI
jgi:hypothetical protein